MTTLLAPKTRQLHGGIKWPVSTFRSQEEAPVSRSGSIPRLADRPSDALALQPPPKSVGIEVNLQSRLRDVLVRVGSVGQYFDYDYRALLISNLKELFETDGWEADDTLPDVRSFETFLRLVLYINPGKRPGLAISPSGNAVAVWFSESGRVVLECLPKDRVRWVLRRTLQGEPESAAGETEVHRMQDVVEAYDPEDFFEDADKVHT